MSEKVTLGSLVGTSVEEEFLEFDLTEIQNILLNLRDTDAIDLVHAEFLQQQTLRAADILSEYLGKMIKTTSYLESKVSTIKNKVSLNYQAPEGKTTAEMKKWAGECSTEVAEMGALLAKAKGSKAVLEKKYDIIIRAHHHYKELAMGLRRSVLGYNNGTPATDKPKVADGWE